MFGSFNSWGSTLSTSDILWPLDFLSLHSTSPGGGWSDRKSHRHRVVAKENHHLSGSPHGPPRFVPWHDSSACWRQRLGTKQWNGSNIDLPKKTTVRASVCADYPDIHISAIGTQRKSKSRVCPCAYVHALLISISWMPLESIWHTIPTKETHTAPGQPVKPKPAAMGKMCSWVSSFSSIIMVTRPAIDWHRRMRFDKHVQCYSKGCRVQV